MKATISEKGQVTIPKKLRTRLGLRAGAVIEFEAEGGRLIARKAGPDDVFGDLYGTLDLDQPVDQFIERLRGR